MMQQDLTRLGEINALLGRGTEYEGKLCFEGRVRIDGRFRGSIHSEDMLILGEGADVDGDVHVGKLIVRGGTLRGRVFASQLVELFAPSRVHADIRTPLFFLDRGVLFDGRCTMMDGQPAEPTSMETGAAFISSAGGIEAVAVGAAEPLESASAIDQDEAGDGSEADSGGDLEPVGASPVGEGEKAQPRRRRSRKKSGDSDL